MKSFILSLLLVVAGLAANAHSQVESEVVALTPMELNWQSAPNFINPGAEIVILQGNPFADGMTTLRLKLPAGYRIEPHTHTGAESVTVVSGDLSVGHGTEFEVNNMQVLPQGGFVFLPGGHAHYVMAITDTVIQVHFDTAFDINYVSPSDDPRNE